MSGGDPTDREVTFLKALADPTRLKLLKLLLREELCVCELVDLLAISQPGVSQHLAKLRAAGLVRERRDGMWTYYTAANDQVRARLGQVADFLAQDVAAVPTMAAEWARRQRLNRAQCGPQPVALEDAP